MATTVGDGMTICCATPTIIKAPPIAKLHPIMLADNHRWTDTVERGAFKNWSCTLPTTAPPDKTATRKIPRLKCWRPRNTITPVVKRPSPRPHNAASIHQATRCHPAGVYAECMGCGNGKTSVSMDVGSVGRICDSFCWAENGRNHLRYCSTMLRNL